VRRRPDRRAARGGEDVEGASSAIRQLRGGMLPFPEAFMAFITTQSEEAPAGVFKAELTKARAIRDGKLEGAMLPVLYEFPWRCRSRRSVSRGRTRRTGTW
jgi:phage terminase large subunit-like protein